MKTTKRQHALEPIKLDAYKPLREVVSETLRQAIKDGVLKPGERLMEIQLADELGVSRTPIREAIRKLELEGFVVMVPRRGTYVADISLKDIAQVFEIRSALEELAAGLAAERITPDELEYLERILVEITNISTTTNSIRSSMPTSVSMTSSIMPAGTSASSIYSIICANRCCASAPFPCTIPAAWQRRGKNIGRWWKTLPITTVPWPAKSPRSTWKIPNGPCSRASAKTKSRPGAFMNYFRTAENKERKRPSDGTFSLEPFPPCPREVGTYG